MHTGIIKDIFKRAKPTGTQDDIGVTVRVIQFEDHRELWTVHQRCTAGALTREPSDAGAKRDGKFWTYCPGKPDAAPYTHRRTANRLLKKIGDAIYPGSNPKLLILRMGWGPAGQYRVNRYQKQG